MPVSPSNKFLSCLYNNVGPSGKLSCFHQSSEPLTVASSTFQSWASDILDRAQALTQLPLTKQSTSLTEKTYDFLQDNSTASYTTLAAVLLSLIFLVNRYLMNRNSFSFYGGRGSPYYSNLAEDTPRNLSGHFEYIGPDDLDYVQPHRQSVVREHEPHRPSIAIDHHDRYESSDDPDQVHVRHMLSAMIINFPPYSISEESAYVEDLRKKVADHLRVNPRRVRLVYKGRDLKHNSWPLRRYRMKQNSEVTAVITESLMDYDNPDGHSESGSDSGSGNNAHANARRQQQRPRAHSTVRHRSEDNVPTSRSNGGTHLHPNGHVPSTPVDRTQRESLRPTDRIDRRLKESSSGARGVSPSPAPSLSTVSAIPPADPSTPLGKVQALSSDFHTKWLPDCTRFLLHPPSDPGARTKELVRLSEGVMSQIILKADNIETEGNTDARTVRKSLINEANKVLKELDAYKK